MKRNALLAQKKLEGLELAPAAPLKEEVVKYPLCSAPSIEIDKEVYDKVMYWVNRSDDEVSGFGKIKFVDGVFRVTSAILLEQTNDSTETDINGEALAKAMYKLKDEEGHFNWWFHSHPTFEVFWSSTDRDTIGMLGNNGWIVASVFNQKEEVRSAFYQKGNGFYPPMFIDEIPTSQVHMYKDSLMDSWEKEFNDNVKKKTRGLGYGIETHYKDGTPIYGDSWSDRGNWWPSQQKWPNDGLLPDEIEDDGAPDYEILEQAEYDELVANLGQKWMDEQHYVRSTLSVTNS